MAGSHLMPHIQQTHPSLSWMALGSMRWLADAPLAIALLDCFVALLYETPSGVAYHLFLLAILASFSCDFWQVVEHHLVCRSLPPVTMVPSFPQYSHRLLAAMASAREFLAATLAIAFCVSLMAETNPRDIAMAESDAAFSADLMCDLSFECRSNANRQSVEQNFHATWRHIWLGYTWWWNAFAHHAQLR